MKKNNLNKKKTEQNKMEKELTVRSFLISTSYNELKKWLPKEVAEVIDSVKEHLVGKINQPNPFDEGYYISSLAMKKGWEPHKMERYIENLTKFNPSAAALVLLREIALNFDDLHEGYIEDSEEVWTISMLNGKVEKVDKSKVKNYRNFPAFRTENEAKEARAILSKRLRKMFRGCGK